MLKFVGLDPTLNPNHFSDSSGHDMGAVLRDVDELFQSLGAGTVLRRVVRLRLLGYSEKVIAQRCDITNHAVRVCLERARKMLDRAEVLHDEREENVVSSPRSGGGSAHRVRGAQRDQAKTGPTGRSPRSGTANSGSRHSPVAEKEIEKPHPRTTAGPLKPAQSFGWRDVYYSEVHRYGPKK